MDVNEKNHRFKWVILAGLGMSMIVLNLDFTIVNLAIPVLGKIYHASLSMLEWIVNIYTLTFGAFVILSGKLADKFGHKKIYLIGMFLFLIGSMVAGFAPNTDIILLGRVIQGLGMAATYGMMFVLASESFPPNQKGLAVSMLAAFTAVGQALGPTLGGFLVEYASWRWCFWLNIPFCIVAIGIIYFACQINTNNSRIKIHYPSAVLIIISFFLIVGALNESQAWGFDGVKFLSIFIAGMVVLLITIIWQPFLKNPFINLSFYRCPIYRNVNLIRPFFQFSISSFLFIFPIYFQNGLSYSPTQVGLIMLIMTASIAISAPLAGILNDKFGPKYPMMTAQVLAIVGYILVGFMPLNINWVLLSIGLVFLGVNTGIMYSSTSYAATITMPADKKGVGFGMFSANTFMFISLGIAIMGYVLSKESFSHFQALMVDNPHIKLSAMSSKNIIHDVSGARPITSLAHYAPAHAQEIVSLGKKALSVGFSICMWVFAGLSLISLYFTLLFQKGKLVVEGGKYFS